MMINEAPFGLAEIWKFPVTGGGEFGLNLSVFGEVAVVGSRNGSVDESTVTERRDSEDEESKLVSSANNAVNGCDAKRPKVSGSSDENGDESKAEVEASSRAGNKRAKKSNQGSEPPKDYIHVRARRGQATDNHSLAERARREKISERMRILQDLVPGCNKVIGKALVLDEIINYIQSLQRQVEFLSMKLEAVNSRTSLSIEGFPFKDFGLQTFDSAGIAFGSNTTRELISQVPNPEWLHMQVGGGFERET